MFVSEHEENYEDKNTISLLRKLWRYVSLRRKKQSIFLLIIMVLSGAFELLTLSALVPFLYILQNPNSSSSPIDLPINILGGADLSDIYLVSGFFIFTIIISALLRLFVLWYGGELTARIGSEMGSQAYMKVLSQPYEFHIQTNSSNVINTITGHTDSALGALVALLQLLTASVVVLFILAGLIFFNPTGAILALSLFSFLYIIIGIWSKQNLRQRSIIVAKAKNLQLKSIQEGLGAIREIILDHTQFEYYKIFRESNFILRTNNAFIQFLSVFPKYTLEMIGLSLIAILAMIINNSTEYQKYTIPILGTIALAAQRLLPSLQQIYTGWANLNAANISFAYLYQLVSLQGLPSIASDKSFKLKNCIEFSSVYFKYSENNSDYVFSDLNFTIKAGTRIGIIGPSGGGKSTFVDLIMGLICPIKGEIFVDGVSINSMENPNLIWDWHSTIAHVPQSIFLSDDTILNNIAFGVKEDEIDKLLIEEVAAKAQLLDHINSLPERFNTEVGERGVRLSGGQRQRIGIARALYKRASVLILDEATSALDNENEDSVIDAIENISSDITLIMIAHRLSTLRRCNEIISINNGVVERIKSENNSMLNKP